MDSFRLDKTTLSKEEQELIIFALQNITASGNIETKGTLSRLSALFNEPSPSWIDVDFSRWGQSKYDNNLFDTLRHAILKRQQIAFRYVSSTGEVSNRKVTPLRLIFKGRAWYVICVKKPEGLQTGVPGKKEHSNEKKDSITFYNNSDVLFYYRSD